MKTIKDFINNPINEALSNDKIEYIVSEYASGDTVIEVCESLADVESFIYDGWTDKDAKKIMEGVEKIEPKEFFFWPFRKNEFVLVTCLK